MENNEKNLSSCDECKEADEILEDEADVAEAADIDTANTDTSYEEADDEIEIELEIEFDDDESDSEYLETDESEEALESDTADETEADGVDDNSEIFAEPELDLDSIPDDEVIHSDSNYDADMWISEEPMEEKKGNSNKIALSLYDFVETLALVTIAIVLCFSFIFRLNIVSGDSMNNTLINGEYLLVSDVLYTPTAGDIVVIHDLTAGRYTEPIVKRIVATEGQVVDIDYNTWTLTVDGKVVDESAYRYLDPMRDDNRYPRNFPITVEDGHVFVLGDNRRNSADSRVEEIGQIDERCIVGKVYARVLPFNRFTTFSSPYEAK